MIKVTGLSKKFNKIHAVNNLNLNVHAGDIYGLLGPNGSGKSTTIRMMLSLIYPNSGDIQIFGKYLQKDRVQILQRIGSLVERPDFYEHLSAFKNLEMLSNYSRVPVNTNKIFETLELVGIQDRAHSKVKTFSKGMKQRLGIAQTLVHDPELLILDEPASGLDPSGLRDIRNLLLYLNKELKKTIVLSSHQLQEIEMIANRMIILNRGEKVVEGNVDKLLKEHSYYTNFKLDNIPKSIELLSGFEDDIEKIEDDTNYLRVYCKRETVPLINQLFVKNGILVQSIQVEQSLEDYFLTLT